MNIIRKNTTPEGIRIQFEKWFPEDYTIGVYPIARNTDRYGLVKKGQTFRLTLNWFSNLSEAAGIYDGIKDGYIKLTDDVIVEHYWCPSRDRFYMGLSDSEF